MRKFAIILFLGSILVSCMTNTDQFKLTGSVQGFDTGMVYLQKRDQDKWIDVDSVALDKGEFTFGGKSALPEMYRISMRGTEVMFQLFVENAKINVQIFPDSLGKSVVKGSPANDIFRQYVDMSEIIDQKMEEVFTELKQARDAGDTAAMERADSISVTLDAESKQQLQDFIRANSSTVVAPYLVTRNFWQFELPELEEIVSVLDTSLNASPYMQVVLNRVNILKSVLVGQVAPDFEMEDVNGTPVKLSSLKGKILLVDFWASWCGPCRAENPNVVKAYQAFSSKGFDILGCSFDQNREKWIKAIEDDNLTWTHVSDLKGWGNAAGKLYGVNSIPANVLLDKDQVIIGRNLRGEELMKKLEEVLGPPVTAKGQSKRK